MSYNESEILPFSSRVSSSGVLEINGHSIDCLICIGICDDIGPSQFRYLGV